ncbi:chaplin family protein [Kitasatospora sp. NPDC018058]|uniref:chaplin n=1 Tax=Kitasatospora sp. NPDC018058 TaxID=3364025 RepID=UPI0037BFD74D
MRNVAKKGILTAVATGSVLASAAGYAYAGAEAQGGAVGSPGVASGNSVQVPVEVPINACGNTVDVIGLLNPAYGNHCANVSTSRPAAPRPGQTGQPGGSSGSGGSASSSSGASQGSSASGASASGVAANSPGVISGNSVQAPVHVPINACGNSVGAGGIGNPAFGNSCGNVAKPAPKPTDHCSEGHTPSTPPSTGGDTPCPGDHTPSTPPSTGGNTPSTPSTPPSTGGDTTGGGRNGGPVAGSTPAAPVSNNAGTQAVPAAARTSTPAAPVAAQSTAAGGQLASTGAGGVEVLGAAGLALLIGGGVLYRRARAGAR